MTSAPLPAETTQNEHDRAHLFTVDAALMLLLLSFFSGVILGLSVMIIAAIARAPLFWAWGAGAFSVTIAVAWVIFLLRWFGLTAPIERTTTVYEQATAMPEVVRVELTSEDRKQKQYVDLPTTPDKLALFCRGVMGGRPISLREWAGAGKPFSQNEYQDMINVMISKGWLRWKVEGHPQQGVELTAPGRAVVRAFGGNSPTPTVNDGADSAH